MTEPLRTPITTTSDLAVSGPYSVVICLPSSATRVAMASAEMSSTKGSRERFQAGGGEAMHPNVSQRATIMRNGRKPRSRSDDRRAAWGDDHRDRRRPQEPGVLQPQPPDGLDRDDRV